MTKSVKSVVKNEENALPCMAAHQMLFSEWYPNPVFINIISYVSRYGFNGYQAQEINTEYAKSLIRENEERNKALDKAKIEMLICRAKHEEDLRFESEKRRLNSTVPFVEESPNSAMKINYIELEERFIKSKNLVRIMRDYEIIVHFWDDKRKHYVSFKTKTSMITALNMYVYDEYGKDIEISNTRGCW